jgi:BirA family biotin operon repressor/biotin-[acetyl-CoA-carboxylase] ligase
MDQPSLESILVDLHLPAIRYFPSLGSTNDEAWQWIDSGAPHAALVIADKQTAGRGRYDRHWVTVAGSSLAFSLVLLSPPLELLHIHRLTGLGALAVCQAFRSTYALPAQIKWPNDILLNQRKVGGVLVETRWYGDKLQAAVIGIGINIAPQSISPENLPAEGLTFPATFVEEEINHPVERMELLHGILKLFFSWLERLSTQDFISAWEADLAYLNQWVELSVVNPISSTHTKIDPYPDLMGKLIGLDTDGSLKLLSRPGKLFTVQVGEIQLKPYPFGDQSTPVD